MRDDQSFNIKFVGLVERHPCLYDRTIKEYHLIHIQEKAWATILHNIDEEVTVAECKGRWRNLRGTYTRFLKRSAPESGTASRCTYYLAEYMSFILPFTKSRPAKGNIQDPLEEVLTSDVSQSLDSDKSECDEKGFAEWDVIWNDVSQCPEEDTCDSHSSQKRVATTDLVTGKTPKHPRIATNHVTPHDVNRVAFEDFRTHESSQRAPCTVENSDSDTHFLLSFCSDMAKMTDAQKRRFKMSVLDSACRILDETTISICKFSSSAASTSKSAKKIG